MKGKSRLELYFGNNTSPGLYRTVFKTPSIPSPIVGTRGNTLPTSGLPFNWTPSSQSLAILLVAAVKSALTNDCSGRPLLEGPSSSPAGTLARLLKKRTTSWLHDIFGTDASCRSLLHRMIELRNPRGLQHGPITATLRSEYLSPNDIQIFVNSEDITNNLKAITNLLNSLIASFVPRKDPLAHRRTNRGPCSRVITKTSYPYVLCAEGEM